MDLNDLKKKAEETKKKIDEDAKKKLEQLKR
jgi:hypothetical protein